MSTTDMKDRLPGKRRLFTHLLVVLAVFFSMLGLSLGDLMEIIPLFAPLVASPIFPFFHEIHYLLAVAVALYAAYKYQARLGVAAILLFLAAHIPYFIIRLPEEAPEILRILFVAFVAFFGIWLIDHLQKSETKMRSAEMRYHSLFTNMLEGFAYCRMLFEDGRPRDFVYLDVNAKFEELTGLHDVIGKKVTEIIPGIRETNPELFAIYGRVSLTGKPEKFETYLPALDMWLSVSVYSPQQEHFIAVFDVITERKKMVEALRRSEENFRRSMEDSPLGIRIVDTEGQLLYANQNMLDILGYGSIEELKATPMSKRYTPPSYAEHVKRRGKRRRGEPAPNSYEVSVFHTDGTVRHLQVFRKEVVWDGQQQFQVIYQDITEHKRIEEELSLKAQLLDAATDLVHVTDSDWNLLYVNETSCQTLGYSSDELVGHNLRELLTPEAAKNLPVIGDELVGQERIVESVHIRKDKTTMPVEIHSRTISWGGKKVTLAIVRDITERKKMEEQLMAQDRLASIGQLTSGVAHELNNPLTSVIGFSELLLQNKNLPDDIRDDLRTINAEAQRTARIVKNLLTFARKQPEEKMPLDVNENIARVLELRAYEQKVNNIRVDTHFASDLPQVMGSDFQLQQVFLNIIINAEYFMLEAHQQGNLTITTMRMGHFVRASFADDGPGIPREKIPNLFTPFFTTKPVGQGTGLGLSICYGIVIEHGGRIYAESEPGKGATFIIELPIPPAAINQEAAR